MGRMLDVALSVRRVVSVRSFGRFGVDGRGWVGRMLDIAMPEGFMSFVRLVMISCCSGKPHSQSVARAARVGAFLAC